MKKNIDIWLVITSILIITAILFLAANIWFIYNFSENTTDGWDSYDDSQKYFIANIIWTTVHVIYITMIIFNILIAIFAIFLKLNKLEKLGDIDHGSECNGKKTC